VERDLAPDPSHFKGDDRPVEQVNWYEAIEFCRRLSARTGKNYTLPSEAQWEYACRAGTTTPFHFGATISTEQANYDERYAYGDGPAGKYREQTTDVASFAANAWGLHDMHGNVWEWCLDDWHDNYEGAPQDGSAWAAGEERLGKSCAADPGLARPATAARPTGAIATPTSAPTTSASASAAADQRKVLRGGSCFDKPHICRSAYRISFHPGNRDGDVGFRVCLTSNPAPAASQEAMADAREESQAAAWGDIKPEQVLPAVESLAAAIEPTPPATTPGGNLAPMLADAATLLHQSEANLATTREALRRLVVWGGLSASKAFNGAIVAGVTDWFADGMTGPLPPVWPYIVSREGVEPTPSAPALPPANTYDGGNGTVIEATNSERTSWAVRDGNLCLNFSGEWEPEPYPSSRSADFLARTRWPSAEAAWAALLAHRAANPLYSMAREAASSALLAYNRAANEAKGVQS
jgi:hypothetical protein